MNGASSTSFSVTSDKARAEPEPTSRLSRLAVRQTDAVRRWAVGGGLIYRRGAVLMVNNRRRSGLTDWTTPGGVIDPGETMLEGLTREVTEETGLAVVQWNGPVYTVEAHAVDMDWTLRVETHISVSHTGELSIDDPDGIVFDARWVETHDLDRLLNGQHRWFTEPLLTYLGREQWTEAPHFRYEVRGTDHRSLEVTRIEPAG